MIITCKILRSFHEVDGNGFFEAGRSRSVDTTRDTAIEESGKV